MGVPYGLRFRWTDSEVSKSTVCPIFSEADENLAQFVEQTPNPGLRTDEIPYNIQGDTSRWSKPPVDTKTKVMFYYMGLILNRTFVLKSTGGSPQPDVSPCTGLMHTSA